MNPLKRTEMQFKTRSNIIQTKEGEALTFGFRLGPIAVFVIANMPVEDKNGALVYIKLNLCIGEDWQEYSTESSNSRIRR